MTLILLAFLLTTPDSGFEKYVVATNRYDCLLVRDPEGLVELEDLVNFALDRGFRSFRLQGGEWTLGRPLTISRYDGIRIHSDPQDAPPVLIGNISLKQVRDVELEHLIVRGILEMDQTEDVTVRSTVFRNGGIRMKGRRCNQPNECNSFNRNALLEHNLFENCEKAIVAERMERSVIQNNKFVGDGNSTSCERTVGIEIDGTAEDLDRSLELGHIKGNVISTNFFEQEFASGIRVRGSWSNTFRENHFANAYRAMEFYEESRYNQVTSNYIEYLSQLPPASSCHSPCGIYVGPGTIKNVFLNNFFEQDFELKFLERHRNSIFILDESGKNNVFRSDFR